jgi:hypothetical protein
MEDAAPGASVVPTLWRLGATQAGKDAGLAELTVSVAALLVVLPDELLTTAVNFAPLSELAVAGVV